MRYALILIAIFILGCENETAIQTQDWEPTADQALKAEETAKSYAIAELKLSDTQLSKMKTELTGWKKGGISVI